MVLALGLAELAADKIQESRKKKKRGTAQAGMQNVGGGAGMSQLKKGGMVGGKKKAKAKKTGGAPHNRLY
jgi:hypothetical protein